MKNITTLILVLCLIDPALSNYKIAGRVVNTDSIGVAFAEVRLPGLDSRPTDEQGYFNFVVTDAKREAYFLKGGVDLFIEVNKQGLVILHPPDQKIRLPHDSNIQPLFEIVMCNKGSPLLVRNEQMLEYILRERIQAAIETKEEEFTRRDVLAEQAERLGLSKEKLLTAVEEYKERLRTSPDLNKRGLAALDDANLSADYKKRYQKLAEAETNFRESIRRDEQDIHEGKDAETRIPETYYNLGLTYFEKVRYDSAVVCFSKADSLKPGDTKKMNWLGLALHELARYSEALKIYNRALEIDIATHGRNHPKVAIRLNNIAAVLDDKGDYAGALAKYNEALKIFEEFLGPDHPYTKSVREKRVYVSKKFLDQKK